MKLLSPENAAGRRAPPLQPRAPSRALAACALALGVGACAGPTDDRALEVRSSALGEPMGDYPGYEERVVLYATNRARVSPATEGWPSYPSEPPLQWNAELNQSSRAHSVDMRDTPCFQHPSCDGTDTFTRVLTFYKGAWSMLAENISAGVADPQVVVHNWIYEIGAAPGETGHRDAIFSADLTLIGVGFAAGGATKTPNYWTQDFVGTAVKRPRLADGIHFPKSAAAGGSITFGATYYDAAVGTGQPQVFAVVDGACHGLAMVRGTTALGAYEGAAPLADGCHAYYFVATLGDGVALATYPDTGALQVGTGTAAASCALFATTRPAATCAGAGMGAGGAGGATGAGGAAGTAGAPGMGAAGKAGAGGIAGAAGEAAGHSGGAGATAATGAGGAPASPATGAAGTGPGRGSRDVFGVGCALSGRRSTDGPLAVALLAAAVALARRRSCRAATSS
ncbi:MAG TPA: CAP domain-containing protein [Polyangia bacterium]|jgi:hypothetical protein